MQVKYHEILDGPFLGTWLKAVSIASLRSLTVAELVTLTSSRSKYRLKIEASQRLLISSDHNES